MTKVVITRVCEGDGGEHFRVDPPEHRDPHPNPMNNIEVSLTDHEARSFLQGQREADRIHQLVAMKFRHERIRLNNLAKEVEAQKQREADEAANGPILKKYDATTE